MKFRVLIIALLLFVVAPSVFAQGAKLKTPPIVEQLTTYGKVEFEADKQAYRAALQTGDFERAQVIRDQIIWQGLASVNANYAAWRESTLNGNNKKNFILDVLESGFVSWIGLTEVISTKNAITAALQFLRGGRASYNKNFLNAQTMGAIFNAIEAARTNQTMQIENGLTLAPQEYPLEQALADLIKLHYEGSLTAGIQHLSENSGASLQAARVSATEARSVREAAPARQLRKKP